MLPNEPDITTESFQSLVAHAQELTDAGRLREARRLIAQFVERQRVVPRMLPALAAIYVRLGKHDLAIETMRLAIDALGRNADLLNSFGLLLASTGMVQESRERFEEALILDSSHPDVLRNLAFALHRSGERRRAYAMLVRGYRAAPLSAELRLICGTLLELDGRLSEAAACYQDVVEISHHGAQIELATGRLRKLAGHESALMFEEVMELLDQEQIAFDEETKES